MSLFGIKKKKKKWDKELEGLERFGYKNKQQNKTMLEKYKGDTNLIIEKYQQAENQAARFAESMSVAAQHSHTKQQNQEPPLLHSPQLPHHSKFNKNEFNKHVQDIDPSLKPSMTKLSHLSNTPEPPTHKKHPLSTLFDNDNDYKQPQQPQQPHISRSGSTLRREDKSAIFASSSNLLDDDYWCNQLDSVLREKVIDYIDDHHITDLIQLLAIMKAKKPQSQMRIRRVFNELKWVRNDLTPNTQKHKKIINGHEQKEEYSLDDETYDTEHKKNSKSKPQIAPKRIDKRGQEWLQSEPYRKLKTLSTQILGAKLKTGNRFKNKTELRAEASNESCVNIFQCICMHRIEAVLLICHSLKQSKLFTQISIAALISFLDIYGYQQLLEDFQHLQIVHAQCDRVAFRKLCEKFERQYPCDIDNCVIFERHYRDRSQVEQSKNMYFYQTGEDKTTHIQNNKDVVFQQHCDKIHSYLLHSMLKFDANGERFESVDAIKRRNELNKYAQGRSFSSNNKGYRNHLKRKKKSERFIMKRCSEIAIKCDDYKLGLPLPVSYEQVEAAEEQTGCGGGGALMMSVTASIDVYDNEDMSGSLQTAECEEDVDGSSGSVASQYSESDEEYKLYPGIEEDVEWTNKIAKIATDAHTNDHLIYALLVEHMGIFRWQALHGFHYDQYRAMDSIRPTFKNIKQEVLLNDFHQITNENWNQTLRKAKAFHQSWAGKRIRTKQEGQYEDMVSNTVVRWDKNEAIAVKEVLTLKLYTDFDQLQFELKKCFRFEQYGSLVSDINDDDDLLYAEEQQSINTVGNRDEIAKKVLEKRLMNFYHWRMSLQITLKKFGKPIQGMDLYHGVNEKMILYPHATTQAFHGPLSTTASFHVAKTFATDKGMVLKISSSYPRLYHCRAFDASLLSDYPEEQEWLVGFVYTRIRKVHTKEKWDIVALPTSTQLRFSFFVIHLFKLQAFSLSEDLAEILSFLLEEYLSSKLELNAHKVYNTKAMRDLCPNNEVLNATKNGHKRFWKKLMKRYYKEKKSTKWSMSNVEKINCRIMSVLISKFKSFAHEPKIIRFDDISYNLRHHFMNKVAQSVQSGKNIYRISFKKIQKIFVNVEEIYLQNHYKLDNELLQQIIDFLLMMDCKGNRNKDKIKQIKFLYYDYKGNLEEKRNKDKYFPTVLLSKQLLNKLNKVIGWQIIEKHQYKRNTELVYGVGIRLKPIVN